MGDLYSELIREQRRIIEKIHGIDEFLKDAPDGLLSIQSRNGHHRYYVINSNPSYNKIPKTYITKDNLHLAETLAKKRYYEKLRPVLSEELKEIESFLHFLNSNKVDSLIRSMPDYRKSLMVPTLVTIEEKVKNFISLSFTTKGISEDQPRYPTFNGEYVRSKSEKIIADELSRAGIPYKYECPQLLKGYDKNIYPDFTVINPRNGKIFYWEHLGKLDNPDYYNSILWRMELYNKNGIVPGAGLILTFESSHNPLNINTVRWNIQEYLK